MQVMRFNLVSSFIHLHFLFNTGTYKYCYRGSYSPNCPVDLSLRFAEQRVMVHSNLPMDCQEYKFNRVFETILPKGIYKVNVRYYCYYIWLEQIILPSPVAHVTGFSVSIEICKTRGSRRPSGKTQQLDSYFHS